MKKFFFDFLKKIRNYLVANPIYTYRDVYSYCSIIRSIHYILLLLFFILIYVLFLYSSSRCPFRGHT